MSFAVCVNATTMNCAICGKPATEWGILGRGRHRICTWYRKKENRAAKTY